MSSEEVMRLLRRVNEQAMKEFKQPLVCYCPLSETGKGGAPLGDVPEGEEIIVDIRNGKGQRMAKGAFDRLQARQAAIQSTRMDLLKRSVVTNVEPAMEFLENDWTSSLETGFATLPLPAIPVGYIFETRMIMVPDRTHETVYGLEMLKVDDQTMRTPLLFFKHWEQENQLYWPSATEQIAALGFALPPPELSFEDHLVEAELPRPSDVVNP